MKCPFIHIACLLLIVDMTHGLHAQTPDTQQMDEIVQPFAEAGHFSGVVLLARDGEITYEKAFGFANVSHEVQNTVGTRFQIASVTKDFTLAIANALIDEGLLAEEDTLQQFIPEFPGSDKITVAMLASHRSGIPHRVGADESKSNQLEDIVDLASEQPLAFEPGADRLYSSAGYSVLARVLEIASGKSYQQLLSEYVLQPAGMTDTLDFNSQTVVRNLANSYLLDADGFLNAPVKDYSFLAGAGSAISTARDIFRFGQAIASGQLGKSVREGMVNRSGRIVANGSTNGFRCQLILDAETGTGLVLVSNLASGANDLIIKNAQDILADKQPDPVSVPEPDLIAEATGNLQDYIGMYKLGNSKFEILVQLDTLYAGPYKLLPMGGDRFFNYWSYAEIEFVRNEQQQVIGLEWSGSAGNSSWTRQ